jgi:hypothetical protein
MMPVLARFIRRVALRCALVLALLCPLIAHADRALIIGVGVYQRGELALPGIDRDVENAQRIAAALGVERAQQKVLRDAQATARAVQEQIRWALAAGPTERVVIYFSGHGTQALDADGKSHSALVAHDYRPLGDGHAEGVILGNWIGAELARSRAALSLLLVDACHSGAITKAAWRGSDGQLLRSIVPKYVVTPGVTTAPAAEALFKAAGASARWVALTAVQADQVAPASPIGSPFTLSLWSAMASADPAHMSARQLRDATTQDLKLARGLPVNSTPAGVNPQVWGSDPALLNAPLAAVTLAAAPAAHPPKWQRLEQLAARSEPGAVKLSGVKDRYRVGEPLTLTLKAERGGYLTVINVDQQNEGAVIVPNRALAAVRLNPGTYSIPDDLNHLASQRFQPRAASAGQILLVAVLTPEPLEFKAPLKGLFGELDERALELIEAQIPSCSGCRLFVADAEDAERATPSVKRPEAVSVRTEIVP